MMKTGFFKRWNTTELLLIVFLFEVAVVFRFWMLGFSPFGADAMEFYKLATRSPTVMSLWLKPPWMNQIPLNETLSLLMVKIGLPPTPFVVRLPFAVMGVLALFFVWRFARRWFGAGPALMTLLLAVFNPYQIYFSRTAYHYSGALCWSAALFLAFWSIWESLKREEAPSGKQLTLWFLAAAVACHMHMSVWVVAGLQGLLMLIFGFRLKKDDRNRFLFLLLNSAALLGALMSRWIMRAISMSLNKTKQLGESASSEFLRLLPSYFVGENGFAVALLLIFIALTVFAWFRASEQISRFRSLARICVLHILVMMLYVAVVGGGIAKITYFSAIWPHFILLLGVGSFLGVRALTSGAGRTGLYALLLGVYIAFAAWPVCAIVHLEGVPTPYYKINDWILENLPAGTLVLTDRWLEPWNELAVHNPGTIRYAFTLPDEPLEIYKKLNWRKTAEMFFEKYPTAAFLELERGKYEAECGKWNFPQTYFARCVSITNESAMVLRKTKVFPLNGFSSPNTNRVVTHIFYNTTEDVLAAARKQGRDVLRLYGKGWVYIKPGWQARNFNDYQMFGASASIDLYNLKETPLVGSIEIYAATQDRPKPVTVSGVTTTFSSKQVGLWSVPMVLQPGCNTVPFTSPSNTPLFVLDIRWKPVKP